MKNGGGLLKKTTSNLSGAEAKLDIFLKLLAHTH